VAPSLPPCQRFVADDDVAVEVEHRLERRLDQPTLEKCRDVRETLTGHSTHLAP